MLAPRIAFPWFISLQNKNCSPRTRFNWLALPWLDSSVNRQSNPRYCYLPRKQTTSTRINIICHSLFSHITTVSQNRFLDTSCITWAHSITRSVGKWLWSCFPILNDWTPRIPRSIHGKHSIQIGQIEESLTACIPIHASKHHRIDLRSATSGMQEDLCPVCILLSNYFDLAFLRITFTS